MENLIHLPSLNMKSAFKAPHKRFMTIHSKNFGISDSFDQITPNTVEPRYNDGGATVPKKMFVIAGSSLSRYKELSG